MYSIELLINSLQSQDLRVWGKSHWNWVQNDLTGSLLGESVSPWQQNLGLVLVPLRIFVSMPEIDYFVTFCSQPRCLE